MTSDANSTAPSIGTIKVDIWSDVACPWCYIGKRNFETALATFPGNLDVEVEYHSYQLSPDAPVDYEGTHEQFLSEQIGVDMEHVKVMTSRVVEIAEGIGLHYDYEHLTTTNTFKAHELLHYAKAHGKQAELKEALLKAYFIEGGHVGRIDDLVDYAQSVGLDPEGARRALETDEFRDLVRADILQAQAYGITGVPFFLIDEKYGVPGAQEPDTFISVLARAAMDRASAGEE